MSNLERFENIKQIVQRAEPDFNTLARIHNAVNYQREASFALQALSENSYLATTAMGDQDSLKRAIINIAAIGLSLSPVFKLAYLVPRDKKVYLDISYRGYIQLAVDIGAVKWVKAEVVHEKDTYEYQGMGEMPVHKFNPFSDRGPKVGVYCVAKTHDGEYIVEQMSIEEIYAIRNRSMSWRAYEKDKSKTSPWNTDEGEMIKKTIIKRAYKAWPMTDTRARERFVTAIEETNDMDFSAAPAIADPAENVRAGKLQEIRTALEALDRKEAAYIEHLVRVHKREIKALDDLTDIEINQAVAMLNQLVESKKKKEAETEVKREDAV